MLLIVCNFLVSTTCICDPRGLYPLFQCLTFDVEHTSHGYPARSILSEYKTFKQMYLCRLTKHTSVPTPLSSCPDIQPIVARFCFTGEQAERAETIN